MRNPPDPAEQAGAPDPATVAAEVVLPVLRGLTRPDEVDDVAVARSGSAVRVRIVLRGETWEHVLWEPSYPPWSPVEARDRLRSDLQDFIAESSFGWGQRRGT